ncbi:MAG: GerMN domain-containing protein [Armatimonadetes bacterium]|nr:GerMN domain-containing protein [Armatimonadota bacterium]
MSKATKVTSKLIMALLLSGVGLASMTAYSRYAANEPLPKAISKEATEQAPGEKPPAEQTQPPKETASTSVTVLTPHSKDLQVTFDSATVKLPEGENPMVFALNHYLRLISSVPADAKVLGVSVDGGVATVNFTSAIDAGYGSADEKVILDGISATLAQFPDIKSVKFSAEGKPLTTLGHADLTDPTPIIRNKKPTP